MDAPPAAAAGPQSAMRPRSVGVVSAVAGTSGVLTPVAGKGMAGVNDGAGGGGTCEPGTNGVGEAPPVPGTMGVLLLLLLLL